MFLAVYGRVVGGGTVRLGDALADLGTTGRDPFADLPPRAPAPRQWPRIVDLGSRAGGRARLASTNPAWPLPAAEAGATIRLHPGLGPIASVASVKLDEMRDDAYWLSPHEALAGLAEGTRLILTGPYEKPRPDRPPSPAGLLSEPG
jgi:hypothetical protein